MVQFGLGLAASNIWDPNAETRRIESLDLPLPFSGHHALKTALGDCQNRMVAITAGNESKSIPRSAAHHFCG